MSPLDRSQFLGGSDAAAVLGLSPYATPLELWREKTRRAEKPPIDPGKERILKRGKLLEPVILEMLIDKLREQGHAVELLAVNQRYTDPEHSFLACEIDFELMLNGEHINGDCKSVIGFARKKWGEEETEEVPIEYAAQFMHGLMVTGRRRCLVAALIGLDDVRVYWVERDDETIEAMRAKEVLFWNEHVLGDTAPDPLNFSDIKLLFPRDNGQATEATEEIAEAVEQLKSVKHRIKVLEEEEERLAFDVAEFISPNASLTYNGKEIATWKGQIDSRLDLAKLREDHPAIAEEYTRRKPIRVLRLKKGK